MLKRGQVTIFIILGIIIIVAIVFGISMRKQIAKAVTGTETSESLSFTEQSQLVKEHVEDCLRLGLEELAKTNQHLCSRPGMTKEDCMQAITQFVKSKANGCIDFSTFDNLDIDREGNLDVEVSMTSDRTQMNAFGNLKVIVSQGDKRASFSEFSASYPLKGPMYEVPQ